MLLPWPEQSQKEIEFLIDLYEDNGHASVTRLDTRAKTMRRALSILRTIPSSIRPIPSSIRPIPSFIRLQTYPELSGLTVADYFSE